MPSIDRRVALLLKLSADAGISARFLGGARGENDQIATLKRAELVLVRAMWRADESERNSIVRALLRDGSAVGLVLGLRHGSSGSQEAPGQQEPVRDEALSGALLICRKLDASRDRHIATVLEGICGLVLASGSRAILGQFFENCCRDPAFAAIAGPGVLAHAFAAPAASPRATTQLALFDSLCATLSIGRTDTQAKGRNRAPVWMAEALVGLIAWNTDSRRRLLAAGHVPASRAVCRVLIRADSTMVRSRLLGLASPAGAATCSDRFAEAAAVGLGELNREDLRVALAQGMALLRRPGRIELLAAAGIGPRIAGTMTAAELARHVPSDASGRAALELLMKTCDDEQLLCSRLNALAEATRTTAPLANVFAERALKPRRDPVPCDLVQLWRVGVESVSQAQSRPAGLVARLRVLLAPAAAASDSDAALGAIEVVIRRRLVRELEPELVELADAGDVVLPVAVRVRALEALAPGPTARSGRALLRALAGPDVQLQAAGLRALTSVRASAAVAQCSGLLELSVLEKLGESNAMPLREAALRVLATRSRSRFIATVQKILQVDCSATLLPTIRCLRTLSHSDLRPALLRLLERQDVLAKSKQAADLLRLIETKPHLDYAHDQNLSRLDRSTP